MKKIVILILVLCFNQVSFGQDLSKVIEKIEKHISNKNYSEAYELISEAKKERSENINLFILSAKILSEPSFSDFNVQNAINELDKGKEILTNYLNRPDVATYFEKYPKQKRTYTDLLSTIVLMKEKIISNSPTIVINQSQKTEITNNVLSDTSTQIKDLPNLKIDTVPIFSNNVQEKKSQEVIIIVSAEGKTKQDAVQAALRNAIEQAFGAFISSNTTILNDKIVRDEIVSISNGNIEKFDILNEIKQKDSSYLITLNAKVSIGKLIEFCESKGIKVEFSGGVFAANIRQKRFTEESELNAIWNTLFLLNPLSRKAYDYKVTVKDPIELNHEKNTFHVEFQVDCFANSNIEAIFTFLSNVLSKLSIPFNEISEFERLGMNYSVIKLNGINYFLRNIASTDALNEFFQEFDNIKRQYIIDDGIKRDLGSTFCMIPNIELDHYEEAVRSDKDRFKKTDKILFSEDINSFEALSIGGGMADGYFKLPNGKTGPSYVSKNDKEQVGLFRIDKLYSLDILEKIKEFKVYPNYLVSNIGVWKYGGIIFYEDSSKYLIRELKTKKVFSDKSLVNFSQDYDDSKKIENILYNLNTDTIIGSGIINTKKLASIKPDLNTIYNLATKYSSNSYKDWYIPSKIEAEYLLNNDIDFNSYKDRWEPSKMKIYTSSIFPKNNYYYHSQFYILYPTNFYGATLRLEIGIEGLKFYGDPDVFDNYILTRTEYK